MLSMCPCTGNYWWGSFNPELSDWEMYRWWWDRNWIWVHFLCSRGIYTTTRWGPSPDGGRGRSSRRSLLLRVRVCAPLLSTDHQLVQYTALLPRAGGVETMATLRDQGGCKPPCVVCRSLSFYCLLVTVRVFCLPNNLDLIVMTSSGVSKRDWTPSMQDAIPHRGFYVIKVHDLIGSFSTVPRGQREKLWCEFFLDPLQGGDHGSEKVTGHQLCQRVHMSMEP
jgi:hypothetical protein